MANKYTVAAIGATFRTSKNMITLFNGLGSDRIVKVYKIWMLNNQSVAITGVMTNLILYRVTSIAGGGALTPVKHNSMIDNLPSQIIAAEGATNTLTSIFRRINWSSEEPISSASNVNLAELNPNWNLVWDTQIDNINNLEPIVCNEGQGVCLNFVTNSNVGQGDFFIEFTAD